MKAADISFLFIVGSICVIILAKDISVMSILTVCCIIAVAYIFKQHNQNLPSADVGSVVMKHDPAIKKVQDVLDTWQEFDMDLYETQVETLTKFFNLYTELLMEPPTDRQQILQKFDILLDVRKQLLDDSYTWVFKGSSIPYDLDAILSKPLFAITHKYVGILRNKLDIEDNAEVPGQDNKMSFI